MKPETAKYLWDALGVAQRIARFVGDQDFDAYQSNEMLRAAVERQFEIIGEALGRVRKLDREAVAEIPDLDRIIAFRNILIHSYASVDDRLVWGVIEGKLDALVKALTELLGGAET